MTVHADPHCLSCVESEFVRPPRPLAWVLVVTITENCFSLNAVLRKVHDARSTIA